MLSSTPLSMVSDLNNLNSEMSQIPSIVFSDNQGGSNPTPGLGGAGSNTGSVNNTPQSNVAPNNTPQSNIAPNANPTNESRRLGNIAIQ